MTKTKQYKTFAFPNELTDLETYHYYLLEFDVIPKRIPGDKIAEIFTHAASDYLEGFLDTPTFSTIAFHLMVFLNMGEHVAGLSRLLSYCSELEDIQKEKINEIKNLLNLYLNDHSEFIKLYETGKL